jgi:RimJ/RimL family protein N-acetyltransferase
MRRSERGTAQVKGDVLSLRLEARDLSGRRLRLEPLHPDHADEMAPLLDDVALHTFIGGEPASAEELRDRYTRQVVGRSPDGSERWHNWVIRRRDTGEPVGTTQATLREEEGWLVAEVAWVVASAHQRQGFAREAAGLMVRWLREHGVDAVVAHVHPQHHASMAVARSVGLGPTDVIADGEVRWTG